MNADERRLAKDSHATASLARAALWQALALGFRPPDAETIERLTVPAAVADLVDAAQLLEERDAAMGLTATTSALELEHADLESLTARHQRHFGHTARGEVPPYETEYGNEALFQQPQELSDIAAFLRAFGLMVRPATHERLDHVTCECEFLSFLCIKDAYATGRGDEETLQSTRDAYRLFLRDHLGHFAPAFARRLRKADEGGWYGGLASLLLAFTESECRRIGIPCGSERLGLRPDPATCSAPIGCSLAGEEGCSGANGS